MRRLLAELRALWRGLWRPSEVDAEMSDEMRFHIEMESKRLQERGLSAEEAARQASIAFGGVEKYRGAGRDAFGFTWMRGMSVDFKLGLRMLAKFPGLTAVALFALSLAIGAGAAYLEFINDLMHGKLPFPEADRIVGIQTWDQEGGNPDNRQTASFVEWRGSLRSIDQLAAYRTIDRNLITAGQAEQVQGVEISASAFQIAQVPPLLGRPLVPDDERGGAPPVAVLGYDLWTTRFGSDAGVIGTPVRLGKETYVVVGVMPEGFGMPVSHSLWIPLRLNDAFYPRREGPATKIFGKLAPGMTVSTAQAELSAIADRDAIEFAATDRHLRPVVKPYVESWWSAIEDSRMQTIVFYGANVLFLGLLALCGANIATLVFARTATRDVEISVRTALGASRARIAGQLFAEALVLSSIAAGVGLTVASFALQWVKTTVSTDMGEIMFWWNDSIAPETIVYAAVLAVMAALIIGVTPALKATGPRVQERLKQSTGATSSGLRFGGIWTGVIVTQVAVTVVFLAIVGMLGWSAYVTGGGKRDGNFQAAEYVAARFGADRSDPDPGKTKEQAEAEYKDQIRATYAEIARQLAADPAVESISYGARLPGMNFLAMRIDVDGMPAPASGNAQSIRRALVGLNYHEAFKTPLIRGRYFSEGDLADGRYVAIVDQTFVRTVLNGQDAIGRHIRSAGDEGRQPGPWVEIVGVVGDITDPTRKKAGDAMLFEPAAAEAAYPLYVAVHARTNPKAVMSRIRLVAAEVDPALRVTEMMTMDDVGDADRLALDFFARMMAGVSIVAMILATAGVYALMSFTVSRRTPEIGIRVALGANPRRIVAATLGRALMQVALGLIAGSIPAALIVANLGPEVSATAGTEVAIGTGLAATVLVAIASALACIFPAVRALTIQPTDALKSI